MKWDKSDWYVPRDLLFILSWHFVVISVGIIVAMFLPALSGVRQGAPGLFYVSIGVAIAGVLLLFFAKTPVYRQHKFFTFGPGALPGPRRKLYWIAYALIGASITIMSLFFLLLNNERSTGEQHLTGCGLLPPVKASVYSAISSTSNI